MKKSRRRRGMPAGLRKYWAKKRAGKRSAAPKARRRRRVSAKRFSAVPAGGGGGPVKRSRRRRRASRAIARTRRRSRGLAGFGGSRRAFFGVPVNQVLMLGLGATGGVVASNILLPKIAARWAWAGTPFGQAVMTAGIGGLGYIALRRVNGSLALGFAVGAVSIPMVGLASSVVKSAGLSGLADLSHGAVPALAGDGSVAYSPAPVLGRIGTA